MGNKDHGSEFGIARDGGTLIVRGPEGKNETEPLEGDYTNRRGEEGWQDGLEGRTLTWGSNPYPAINCHAGVSQTG